MTKSSKFMGVTFVILAAFFVTACRVDPREYLEENPPKPAYEDFYRGGNH